MTAKPALMRKSLTEGSISRSLMTMAMPMAIGILATMSFNIVDTFFVAGLGDEALAALSFTFPVVMVAISLAVGLGAGASSVVAMAAGKKDEASVRALTTDVISLTCILCLVFSIVGLLTIDPFFSALGAPQEILPLIHDYMVPWYLSITMMVAPMVGLAAIRALGNTKLQANLMLLMALANAILDPFLIYGWWIFPRLEIEGAAIASLIVRVGSFFVVIYYLHYKMHLFVNPFCFARVKDSWRKILHVGIPAMATNLIIPVSGAVIVAMVAEHGPEAVAGFGVATRVESMALILFYALSAVIGPFCGQNLGAEKFQRLIDSQRICGWFSVLSGVVIAIILVISGPMIVKVFSDQPEVMKAAIDYLWVVPISYCGYGIVMCVNASFNGLGRPMPGVVISSARVIFLLLPLAWIGNHYLDLMGIFIAVAVSNMLIGVASFIWIKKTIHSLKNSV